MGSCFVANITVIKEACELKSNVYMGSETNESFHFALNKVMRVVHSYSFQQTSAPLIITAEK
jgi:hypothetical protein